MDAPRPIAGFTVPWGGQQIELQEVVFDGGGAPLLRVRIREGRRFTIFDIDAVTASTWGRSMEQWAARQLAQMDMRGAD
ncbi:MAG: hypothetical protein E6R14_07935 [Thermomicrobiales bacterium]|nr:MAG: hypothetical protein E6R14_07935 [Thermomicrobiales bacterium]